MTANISLDTVLKPFVIATNVGVNTLTKLFYSCLNPKLGDLRSEYAAVFHYNVKATLFNAATAFLVFSVINTLAGRSSFRSSIIHIPLTLFIRTVLEKSLSFKEGGKSVLNGIWSNLTDEKSLEGSTMDVQANTTACLAYINTKMLAEGKKEDLLIFQGFPILKNWASFPK